MFVLSLGTPTAFPAWIAQACGELATVAWGPALARGVVFAEEVRDALSTRAGRPIVLHADIPESGLVDALQRSGAPAVLSFDGMLDGLRYTMDSRGISLREGIRFLSQSYSTLEPFFLTNGSALFTPSARRLKVETFVAQLADVFAVKLSAAGRAEVVRRLVGDRHDETVDENLLRRVPHARGIGDHGLEPDEAALAREALGQFERLWRGEVVRTIRWPASLLHNWDALGSFLGEWQELTGPSRILTAGHVMHLPVGSWRVRVVLEIAENLSGNEIVADILLGERSLGGVRATLPAEGIYEFETDAEVDNAFPPAQLRIVLRQGAIEGRMRIRSVEFERL